VAGKAVAVLYGVPNVAKTHTAGVVNIGLADRWLVGFVCQSIRNKLHNKATTFSSYSSILKGDFLPPFFMPLRAKDGATPPGGFLYYIYILLKK
jgi:hypothetical protein